MKAEVFLGKELRLHADLLQIWRRLLETTDLSIDDDFFDKGGDSLLATDLMLELERLIGKPIPQTLLFEASTIRALTDRLIQAQELQLKPAVKIGAVSSGETPLLFFHGDWTAGGFYVQHLARKLGPELPVIAIAPHGMHGQPVPQSVEAMAADRLPAIMEAQPEGPYRLGGHCVGATVAFETARLLMASGHHVELVAMVEPPWFVNGELSKMRGQLASAGERTEVFEIETNTNDDMPTTPDMKIVTDPTILERYRDSLVRYSPSPLSLPLVIFTSEFDGRPWCQLGRDCELFEVVGNHYDWITTRAYVFADRLKNRLRLIRAAAGEQNDG
jgi:surfactin synthase thioesterase subunit/acyl carrier protein